MSAAETEPGEAPERPPRWPYLLATVLLIADQVTKLIAVDKLEFQKPVPVIDGVFAWTYVHNPGAAWGMLGDYPQALWAFSVVVFCLLVLFRTKLFFSTLWQQVAYGLLIGGILGNMVDRMQKGYVVDFIDVYIGSYNWPVFNLADSWICIGAAVYLFSSREKKDPVIVSTDKPEASGDA